MALRQLPSSAEDTPADKIKIELTVHDTGKVCRLQTVFDRGTDFAISGHQPEFLEGNANNIEIRMLTIR